MGEKRSDLREFVIERSGGRCEWVGCPHRGEEMAHLEGIKAGGRKSADEKENVAWLCRPHHDVLDGRTVAGRKYAVRSLLRKTIEDRYSPKLSEEFDVHLQAVIKKVDEMREDGGASGNHATRSVAYATEYLVAAVRGYVDPIPEQR